MEDLPPHIWCRGQGNRGIGTFVTLANIIHTGAASRKIFKSLSNKEFFPQWLRANVMEKEDWVYIDDLPDPIYNGRVGQIAGMIPCGEENIKLCWVEIGGRPVPQKNGSIQLLSVKHAPLTKKVVLPQKNLYKVSSVLPTACMRNDAGTVVPLESTKRGNTSDTMCSDPLGRQGLSNQCSLVPWHEHYAAKPNTALQLESHRIDEEEEGGMRFFQFSSETDDSCSEPLLRTNNGAQFQLVSGNDRKRINIDSMRHIWNHLLSAASTPYQMRVTPWLVDRLSHDVPEIIGIRNNSHSCRQVSCMETSEAEKNKYNNINEDLLRPNCVGANYKKKNGDTSWSNTGTEGEQQNGFLICHNAENSAFVEQSLQVMPAGLQQLEVRRRVDPDWHESIWTLRVNGSPTDTMGHVVGNTPWNSFEDSGTWNPFI